MFTSIFLTKDKSGKFIHIERIDFNDANFAEKGTETINQFFRNQGLISNSIMVQKESAIKSISAVEDY